MVLEMFDASV